MKTSKLLGISLIVLIFSALKVASVRLTRKADGALETAIPLPNI
jgi:hypothetical protein